MKILDLGCGTRCLSEAIGLDIKKLAGVDVISDLNLSPLPFRESTLQKIHCHHVIEHIQNLDMLVKEIYRVSQNQAMIQLITPHYSCYKSWINPNHIHHFALDSIPQLFQMALGEGKFEVLKKEIKFTGAVIELIGWLIYKISPKQYEKHFGWIFPAAEIHTAIQILK